MAAAQAAPHLKMIRQEYSRSRKFYMWRVISTLNDVSCELMKNSSNFFIARSLSGWDFPAKSTGGIILMRQLATLIKNRK